VQPVSAALEFWASLAHGALLKQPDAWKAHCTALYLVLSVLQEVQPEEALQANILGWCIEWVRLSAQRCNSCQLLALIWRLLHCGCPMNMPC